MKREYQITVTLTVSIPEPNGYVGTSKEDTKRILLQMLMDETLGNGTQVKVTEWESRPLRSTDLESEYVRQSSTAAHSDFARRYTQSSVNPARAFKFR